MNKQEFSNALDKLIEDARKKGLDDDMIDEELVMAVERHRDNCDADR